MNIIDTHSHIYLPEFADDKTNMIERSLGEGVIKILMPAIDSTTHEEMIKTEGSNPSVFFSMIGLHPCSVKETYKNELKIAKEYLGKRAFKAVGEIGLDFYWDTSFQEQQYAAFHEQIEWALQYNLPIVIHSRNSIDECMKVVKKHQNGLLKGVFHCFSGNVEQARQIIDLGFYLGIGGVLTFRNAGLDNVVEKISLENMLLETDAPYLAPVPFRGKRNEPSYLKYVIKKLAIIKNVSANEIAEITTSNAEKLFNL